MKNLIIIILATFVSVSVFAQATVVGASNGTFAADMAEEGTAGAFGEGIMMADLMETNENNEIVKGFKRVAKPLAQDFTGITVQVTTSERELNANDPLYTQFGGVKVMEMLSPKYCYFIGDFQTEAGAQQYIDQVIKHKYPKAKVVNFKNGKVK